jgi:signal transduction histidine kinase
MPEAKIILLIEDELSHVALIRRAFEANAQEYRLLTAHTFGQSERILTEITPDLIFLDVMLPDANGIEWLSSQEVWPYPIVVLTSHGSERLAVEAMKAGAHDYVVKSEFIFTDMAHIASRALREWSHRKQLEEQQLYARTLEIALEKEREIIELREQFTSMISHEFRTPLSVILSSSSMIKLYFDKLPRETILKHLDQIGDQVHRMTAMLNDLLALSRGKSDMQEFRPEWLDIARFCREMIEKVYILDNYQHKVIVEVSDLLPLVHADRYLMEQILLNLLSNAAKYSPPNTPITLSIEKEGDDVVYMVRDRGMGIPEADRDRLFLPFFRASNTRHIRGTGLGLAIVKNNVETHRGTITFTSVAGEGTAFYVRIPMSFVH